MISQRQTETNIRDTGKVVGILQWSTLPPIYVEMNVLIFFCMHTQLLKRLLHIEET